MLFHQHGVGLVQGAIVPRFEVQDNYIGRTWVTNESVPGSDQVAIDTGLAPVAEIVRSSITDLHARLTVYVCYECRSIRLVGRRIWSEPAKETG